VTEATGRRSEIATELPTKYLPAVRYRDLPEPRSLRNYMGASVIILATALGSGELILWVMRFGQRFESARRLSTIGLQRCSLVLSLLRSCKEVTAA
jgi:hypothetical protein